MAYTYSVFVIAVVCSSDTVDSVTPNGVRDIRMFLNGSAMDVMYYASPLYRTEVSSIHFYTSVFLLTNGSSFRIKLLMIFDDLKLSSVVKL